MLRFDRYIKLTLCLVLFSIIAITGRSQELYAATEPASNKAKGSISFRVDNSMMDEINTSKINYHMIPDAAFGITRKLTISGNIFFSNRTERLRYEGGSVYAKYRFFSNDAVQRHFRMAVFGRLSYNNSDIHQEEINMYGHNTGYEYGLVATELLRKVALSTSITYMKAGDNGDDNKFIYGADESKAINYTLSAGKLMLPAVYRNYGQTNLNLMLEILSQFNTGSGKYYIDLAPSVQLIFNSRSRIDVGWRKQISASLSRTAPNGIFVRLEHNLFNVF